MAGYQLTEIRQNSLSYRIGSLLEIKHHYANLQPGGGVMFTSGRTVVVRDGSEWKVKFSFLHRAKPRCGARLDGETPRFVKLQLRIDQFHEIREILWDTAMFDGARSRGRAKIYRRRPPRITARPKTFAPAVSEAVGQSRPKMSNLLHLVMFLPRGGSFRFPPLVNPRPTYMYECCR